MLCFNNVVNFYCVRCLWEPNRTFLKLHLTRGKPLKSEKIDAEARLDSNLIGLAKKYTAMTESDWFEAR